MESSDRVALAGRRALVGGGSRGIGRACAWELARRGAAVIVTARDEDALRQVVDELPKEAGQNHGCLVSDFADPRSLESKIKVLLADGPIHVLINNTGGPPSGSLLDAGAEDFLRALTMHVVCYQTLARALLPGMKQTGFGRIVNIISTSVLTPIRGLGVSNTTRAAVANWARTLADEVAPFGVTVNNVLPGFTDTARLRSLLQKRADQAGLSVEEVIRAAKEQIPMKRFADPSEIAAVVGFLASPAASYLTGVNLPVDGGRLAAQ
jgi:3-oxoacyl-[acyl-carrier protein] reductase